MAAAPPRPRAAVGGPAPGLPAVGAPPAHLPVGDCFDVLEVPALSSSYTHGHAGTNASGAGAMLCNDACGAESSPPTSRNAAAGTWAASHAAEGRGNKAESAQKGVGPSWELVRFGGR